MSYACLLYRGLLIRVKKHYAFWKDDATIFPTPEGTEMYKKILIATDGSDVGNAAFEAAIQLAKTEHAQLFALYVVEYPKFYVPDASGYDPTLIYDALVAEGALTTQQAAERMKKEGIEGQVEVADNFSTGKTTATQIQHMADTLGVDLVVVGTHGRSGFKRMVLGSVAEAFIRISTKPVLLIPQKMAASSSASAALGPL